MTETAEEKITRMAHRMAEDGLRLRQARYVFDAVYIGSLLIQTRGNVTLAASIAEVNPPALHRIINRKNTNNAPAWKQKDQRHDTQNVDSGDGCRPRRTYPRRR